MNGVVAQTDLRWYEFLSDWSVNGTVDEVNFWVPNSQDSIRQLKEGEPFFLRLKRPTHAIGGFGFYAKSELLPLHLAWDVFQEKNGAGSYPEFIDIIRSFRKKSSNLMGRNAPPLGCIILRDVHFLPESEWLPWGAKEGFSSNIVRRKGYDLTSRPGSQLLEFLKGRELYVAPEFSETFMPQIVDQRTWTARSSVVREGQGTFRLRLLDAYGKRCAITGERTIPVLHAAHIQPYMGPASNNVRNGVVLRSDLHELYDQGYVAITPDYRIEVSSRIREEFDNGRDYYAFHGRELKVLPAEERKRPSREVLQWHCDKVFA